MCTVCFLFLCQRVYVKERIRHYARKGSNACFAWKYTTYMKWYIYFAQKWEHAANERSPALSKNKFYGPLSKLFLTSLNFAPTVCFVFCGTQKGEFGDRTKINMLSITLQTSATTTQQEFLDYTNIIIYSRNGSHVINTRDRFRSCFTERFPINDQRIMWWCNFCSVSTNSCTFKGARYYDLVGALFFSSKQLSLLDELRRPHMLYHNKHSRFCHPNSQ